MLPISNEKKRILFNFKKKENKNQNGVRGTLWRNRGKESKQCYFWSIFKKLAKVAMIHKEGLARFGYKLIMKVKHPSLNLIFG
jgi:hypothetical protein